MEQIINQIVNTFGENILSFGAAVLILVGGWILALLISATVRKALEKTTLDNRLAARLGTEKPIDVEAIVGRVVFWLVMLIVLVAVFQVLQLTAVTGPLNSLLNEVFGSIPNILYAAALLFVAWVIASLLRFVVSKGLAATKLDDTLTSQVGLDEERQVPMSETLATIIYWFVFLFFLPGILDVLGLQGILSPVQGLVDDLLGFLPQIFGAALIAVIGWFVARIVRQIVTSLLVALGADNLGDRVGLTAAVGGQTLSNLVGTVIYVLILIPVIISALNALEIEAISEPATNMLNSLLLAIPAIFGAMIVLGAAYIIGRLVSGLVTNLLTTVGFNRVLALIGLGSEPEEGQRTPAEVVGYLVLIGLMLFATIEAADLLGFTILAELVAEFLTFLSQVVLGIIIFGLGLYVANVARNVILGTAGANANLLSQAARLAIIILATAMGLRQMGIADDIVNLAFGLLLGAIAVAVALSFGLGSRDLAARQVESWMKQLGSDDSQ